MLKLLQYHKLQALRQVAKRPAGTAWFIGSLEFVQNTVR